MPYSGRPVLRPLSQFRGTASVAQSAAERTALLEFAAREYRAGSSLRESAELTDRSQTAIRRALDQAAPRSADPEFHRSRPGSDTNARSTKGK